jgi:LPXTG-motif cell wall-anchored protein
VKKLLIVGASIALLLAPVAPASANPTLPAGDALYEMTCDNVVADYRLHSVNTSDNTRTAVGAGTNTSNINECGYQGAMLPGTDWFYFVDYMNGNRLVRVDVTTGVTEVIGDLREGGAYQGIYSLTINDNGNAYALSYETLFAVNLNTGGLSSLVAANTYDIAEGYPYGFAYDPKTKKYYVAEDGAGGLYTLNIGTGVFTLVATNTDYWVGSMAFDSNGYLWVNGDTNKVSRVALNRFGDSDDWVDSAALSPNVYSESLVIARGPGGGDDDEEGLANTGSADATPYLVGGLLAAGIALVFRRRRV